MSPLLRVAWLGLLSLLLAAHPAGATQPQGGGSCSNATTDCHGHAACSGSRNDNKKCSACSTGFAGSFCEQCHYVSSSGSPDQHACSGRGTCSSRGACSSYNPGYSGDYCENTPCFGKNCADHGTCRVSGSSSPYFKCTCAGEYSGTSCQHDPCYQQTCSGHGTCVVIDATHRCDCDDGYTGAACGAAPCAALASPHTGDLPGTCPETLPSGQSCTPQCEATGENPGYYLSYPGERKCDDGTLSTDAHCEQCSPRQCSHDGLCTAVADGVSKEAILLLRVASRPFSDRLLVVTGARRELSHGGLQVQLHERLRRAAV